MKRIIVALTTMFITCTAFNFALGQKLPDAIDKIRPSIIQVRVNCSDRRTFTGTGFFVSTEGLALTAAHVVNPCPNVQATNSAPRIQVGIPLEHKMASQNGLRNNFVFVDARILELDQQHDVALIKVLANPFDTEISSGLTMNAAPIRMIYPSVAALSHKKVREGETVAVSGYPLNYPALMTNAGIIASTQTSRYFDPPQQSGVNIRVAMDYYDVDMSVNHGNSGGPVYNAEGEVVGICDAFRPAPLEDRARATQLSQYGYNAGIAIVVPIAYAEGLVSKHQSPSKAIDSKIDNPQHR